MLFGYICDREAIPQIIKHQVDLLLRSRRIPLVLDLDDTLVRVVADNNPKKYVPKRECEQGKHGDC